jgi:DNA primase
VFEEIKEKLLEQPESIINILETFDCHRARINGREIRCAREENSNPTAVVIRLTQNENLLVKDYELNTVLDLINYLIKIKGASFKDVMNVIKQELHLDSIYNYKRKAGLFGGLYDKLSRSNGEISVTTYPEKILKQFSSTPNTLWLQDGISLSTQRKWNIGYDVPSQRITMPIRTSTGEIMAIKGRLNGEPEEFEPKYLYIVNGPMSQTLFGYSENYSSLYEGNIIVVESEKSVLKLDSWGYNNVVALGSNSLSVTQAKLLVSLNPKCVTFMLDKSLPLENTKKNADILKSFCTMRQIEIKFWDWTENITLDDKSAPCDDTRDEFEYIYENEIKDEKELTVEEECDDDI